MPVADTEAPRLPPAAMAPKPNPRNDTVMFKIFQNVQYNVVQHKKYVKEMIKLYKKLHEDSFRESFKNALHYLFTFGDTSANVDRVVQFVATFCTSLDDEEEFLLFIFNIIFECQCVSGQSVRYRASQLLAAVLAALGEDASLDDDLCDKLLASQMQRLQDTRGAVRCRAALALQRLQNPMEPEDEVTRAYRFHMSCDPSSSVRRAIVMSIAKCTRNVPYVLERLCDVDEAVRRAAFLYISAVNVTQLRVRQRVLTLKVGLTERSQRVRRVVEEILIPGWLSTFQGNIVHLLKAIRLDNVNDAKDSQYVAGKLLESLFNHSHVMDNILSLKRLPISELLEWLPTEKSLRLIPAENLNKETAWYWRHLAEHLQKIDDDETLETILPDLIVLTGYIRALVESPCPSETEEPVAFSTRQYVLHELGSLLRVYDATDPASRNDLHQLITDVLTGDYGPLSSDVIRAFVSALELVVPEVSPRMEVISGVISALRDPPEPDVPPPPLPTVDSTEVKLQRARLRVSLNVAMEAQEEAVRDQNYALAAECKAKVEDIQKKIEDLGTQPAPPPPAPITTIKEKLSDEATLDKCLVILNCALDTPQLTTVTPNLRIMFSELEVEIFQNPDIILNALETVALFGMLDKEFAKEHKAFFFANPIITKSTLVKNKDQFIFESEKPTDSHNALLSEINKGIKLKKTKTNDRSKPNLEGLRKFRRQMTIEEQVQKSMSQANLAASPSGIALNESQLPAPTAEEEEIDEMDDIDHVRDDLQSTKQLLAIELRNKEAQERENKRLLTRIANLEAEVARERAIIKQEQHKTVISVTDAYDERLVTNLKMEVEKAKETADNIEKQYLQAAEERDTAITELEEMKRRNAELEKKLEQALANKIEEMYITEEPLSFYQKRQLDFEKQCRLLNIDIDSPEAEKLRKTASDANNNAYNAAYTNNVDYEGIMPTGIGSRRSSHAIKSQLSVTKDDSFEEEEESEPEEEESEEKKQKRMEKEVRNMRNKIRHLKEKQDNMKRERMAYKMSLKNQQAALKDEKKKYKELKREVDKMAAMMKEVGSDEEDEDEEEEEEEEDEKKSESEEEETETETEQDTESETESESEPEDAPLPKKKDNLLTRVKRHESRVNALKKGNALLMANVDRMKDDVLKQREESCSLKKELDSLIDDLD